MNTQKFLIGTITGGVVFFFLGFLFYAILLDSFFVANAGSATGVAKTNMAYWPLILGNLATGALFTYIFQKWANISTFATGARSGALIGLLMALGYDLVMYDTSNIMNLTGSLVDIVVFTVMSAIAGGFIGLVSPSKS